MILKFFKALFITVAVLLMNSTTFAETPVTLYQSYAGNMNFVGTEATRRTQSNANNSCSVLGQNTTNNATVTGIPIGSTIKAAHLYWAGSGSTPDYSVVFEGGTVTAPTNRRYTANFANTYDFFSGVADVTSQVSAKGNGSYSFRGLTVDAGNPYCGVQAVLAGWSLVVVYEKPSEDFRVINLYEGFQIFRNSNITLTPDNFRIPSSPINGKHATITWEGDSGANLGGANESLIFNGTTLTDTSNPGNAQFNSVSNIHAIAPSTGSSNNNSYGVDFDAYTIDNLLSAGDTSATSTYSSGGDLVLLSSEIISVTNTLVSNLSVTKTATSSFNVGNNATYNIAVNNAGPSIEPGNIVVTDTLPAGLSYVSGVGSGWSCNALGQNVTCTRTGSLAVGSSASPITLTVAVENAASPSVSNIAKVSGSNFDNSIGNNTSTATTAVINTSTSSFTVGGCDTFENGLGNWNINPNGGIAEISSATAQSPSQSLDLYQGIVTARSITADTSSNFKELTMWIRRGSNAFSEDPDSNENLRIQYRNSSSNWITLENFSGNGTPGEIFNRTYSMPAEAKHPNFRVRIRTSGGSTNVGHWHVDDVCLVENTPVSVPMINLQKTSLTLSDPINGNANPKAIPGALAQYSIRATNSGTGAADNNSIVISDAIPSNTALYVNDISGSGTGPIRFVDGSPPSGLSYNYSGLANATDSLSFSNNNGSSYTYTPSPDAEGVDTTVTNIRVSTLGQFLASGGTGSPSFTILFRVKVQ